MMTLPDLTVLRPASVAEAVEALRANPGARVLAGGTDIVPNLKDGMDDPQHPAPLAGPPTRLRYGGGDRPGARRLGPVGGFDEPGRGEVVEARLPGTPHP